MSSLVPLSYVGQIFGTNLKKNSSINIKIWLKKQQQSVYQSYITYKKGTIVP